MKHDSLCNNYKLKRLFSQVIQAEQNLQLYYYPLFTRSQGGHFTKPVMFASVGVYSGCTWWCSREEYREVY